MRLSAFAAALSAVAACNCEGEGRIVDASPELETSAEAIDFGDVRVGEFRFRALKLTNKGDLAALAIPKIGLEAEQAEFVLPDAVPEFLAPNESVEITLMYQPRDVGEDTAVLVITAGEGSDRKDHRVSLRGAGVIGGVGIEIAADKCGDTEGSLSFGRVRPGMTVEKTITVKSDGTSEMTVLAAEVTSQLSTEFAIDPVPAHGTTLRPGQSLEIKVRYTPVDGGADMGQVIIRTDVPDELSIGIPICGEGVAPALCARPVPLDMGTVVAGGRGSGSIRLESCGVEPLDLAAIAISSDASHPSDPGFSVGVAPVLPQTLAPGDTVDVTIEFAPAMVARASAHLAVDSSSEGSPRSYFRILANGGQPCALLVAPMQVNFRNVAMGQTAMQNILLANDGATACTVTTVAITAGQTEFSVTPPMVPAAIAPGASFTVEVRYTPGSSAGPHTGTLAIEEGGVTTNVDLTGNSVDASGCQIEIVPAFVNFGVVPVGTVRSMPFSVNNISSSPCTIRGTTLQMGSSPDLADTSQNLGFILPNRSKQLSVTYRPSQAGTSARGVMVVTTNDVDSPVFNVPVFGTSGQSGICVSPLHLPFGPSTGIRTMDFRIYACGAMPVTVTALDWTTPDPEFVLRSPPALPFTLPAGADQVVTVQYTTADMTGDEAFITVRSNDAASPNIPVRVTGGPEVVPAAAGRYLYYWQITNPITGGDIVRLPLQGTTTLQPYWGPRTGKACSGCHEVSPDGRYVAIVEASQFRIVDTTNNVALALPMTFTGALYMSWKPDVNANPPYQFAYDEAGKIHVGALFSGYLRELQGANNTQNGSVAHMMPTWGSNGKIAFTRGQPQQSMMGGQSGGWGLAGQTEILLVDEAGGTPVPLAGASNNGQANYYPRFSPNGRWIVTTYSQMAMSTIAAADARLRLIRSDNSGMVRDLPQANSAPTDGATSYATWSVDGAFLSFASTRAGGRGDWDIWLAPVDPMTGIDGPATNIAQANSGAFEHAAQWSP